jgi:hypothetical protein
LVGAAVADGGSLLTAKKLEKKPGSNTIGAATPAAFDDEPVLPPAALAPAADAAAAADAAPASAALHGQNERGDGKNRKSVL